MSTTRTIELRIIRELLCTRGKAKQGLAAQSLIRSVAIAAGLAALAAFVPGLIWILFLGAVVLSLGS